MYEANQKPHLSAVLPTKQYATATHNATAAHSELSFFPSLPIFRCPGRYLQGWWTCPHMQWCTWELAAEQQKNQELCMKVQQLEARVPQLECQAAQIHELEWQVHELEYQAAVGTRQFLPPPALNHQMDKLLWPGSQWTKYTRVYGEFSFSTITREFKSLAPEVYALFEQLGQTHRKRKQQLNNAKSSHHSPLFSMQDHGGQWGSNSFWASCLWHERPACRYITCMKRCAIVSRLGCFHSLCTPSLWQP